MHSNLTRTPTPYPAPSSIYGSGWFYEQEKAEHAHRAYHEGQGEAKPPKPMSSPTSTSGKSWRAADGTKPCIVCDRGFTPIRPGQLCCSSEHSRIRKNQMSRISKPKRKAPQ